MSKDLKNLTEEKLTNLITDILALAKKNGASAAEACASMNSGIDVNVRLGEVETVEFNRDKSIGITVYKGKSKGSVSTTDISSEAITKAVESACKIAEYTEQDQYAGLADPELLAKNIPDLDLYHPYEITAEHAIELATKCEQAALTYDKKIINSEGANVATMQAFRAYGNSDGFLGFYPVTKYSAACIVIGQDKSSSMQRDYDFSVGRNFNDLLSLTEIGRRAAIKTVNRLNAQKISTCNAHVLFAPLMAAGIIRNFIAAISGGNLYRKSSFLLDSIGKQIFPKFVKILEEPHLLKGLASAPFDAEGVATKRRELVSDGVLQSYILGSYSARKLGLASTGNAGGAHNIVVTPGELDFPNLLKQMDKGLIVTDLMGHGVNLVTGDYSQGAAGFWVENGDIQHPVEEITIAANLKTMFANILAIGNDVDHRNSVITGSILFDNLTIAGN